MGQLAKLVRDKRGATAVEYGLIVALIVLAMMAGFTTLGGGTRGTWDNISTKVINA